MHIEQLSSTPSPTDRADLAVLLTGCVQAGASMGFLAPMAAGEAEAYWEKIFADLPHGHRVLLALRETAGGPIIGSAQLAAESRPNGRHRAEVQKVMVLPAHRRRGLATQLMHEVERLARARGLKLLFLDTSEGRGGARGLYDALGYTYAGGIPHYALDPDGTPAANAIYFKLLR